MPAPFRFYCLAVLFPFLSHLGRVGEARALVDGERLPPLLGRQPGAVHHVRTVPEKVREKSGLLWNQGMHARM